MSGSSQNEDIKTGYLVKAPHLGETKDGTPVCNLRIKVVRYFKKPGDEKWSDIVDGFFNVVRFGGNAKELCKALGKGDEVAVEGRLRSRRRELRERDGTVITRKDGTPVSVDDIYINASSVELLEASSGGKGSQSDAQDDASGNGLMGRLKRGFRRRPTTC